MDGKTCLEGSNDDDHHSSLVVIKYYASYCKICQRAGIQFKKIATEYSRGDVRFAKVEASVLAGGGGKNGSNNSIQHHPHQNHAAAGSSIATSADALRRLGVTKFPFVQIYRQGLCVASFSTGPSHLFVKKVRDTIDLCLERTPDVWDGYCNEFQQEMESNRKARLELCLTNGETTRGEETTGGMMADDSAPLPPLRP